MEPIGNHYGLSVKKLQTQDDAFKIKLTKEPLFSNNTQSPQTCSLVADFAKQMITDEQDLFAPFQLTNKSQDATFADQNYPDCFLWSIPDFGLLKLHRDGSVFFGHSADEAPLMHSKLTFDSTGKLFLETLKAAALHIKSEEAQLCETVVTDQLRADHTVVNSGGLKTKQLLGDGSFLNEALVEFDGTPKNYALLGIKTFQSKKNKQSALDAKVTGNAVRLTSGNQSFQNKKGALCDIAHFVIDKGQDGVESHVINKGSLKSDELDLNRAMTNDGFLQAKTVMKVQEKQFTNKEFGEVKVLGNFRTQSPVLNDGSFETHGKTTFAGPSFINNGNMIIKRGNLNELKKIQSPGKVTAWLPPLTLEQETEFPNINNLELFVQGLLKVYKKLTAPMLTLHVNGSVAGGKDNDHLGTIAATHGPLTIDAHDIDGRYLKFYGKGESLLESTKGDITIGAEARGVDENIKEQFKQQHLVNIPYRVGLIYSNESLCRNMANNYLAGLDYTLDVLNGAYAASDSTLTLKSAANIFVRFGAVLSVLGNNLVAQKEIENLSSKISSHGPIGIQSDTYIHGRKGATMRSGRMGPYGYPGSGPAQLESLDRIDFQVNKIKNVASSMRSGKGIFVNGNALEKGASYIEEPQTFYQTYLTSDGVRQSMVLFNQSCITQSADIIKMNLGDFAITGNMNSGTITMQGKNTGLFANNKRTRQTLNPKGPVVENVTAHMYDQAKKPGIYHLGVNNSVETEFPLGTPSRPQKDDLVLLENPEHSTSLNWQNLFNPLSSINLDLHLQQLISNLAGKVCLGNAKGNNLATALWANANNWHKEHGKDIMSQADLQQLNRSMLLSQIVYHGTTPQQHMLLCIVPNDVNPYQDNDMVAEKITIHTVGDQTHQNNRLVAEGPGGITIKSATGDANFETEKYTVTYPINNGTVTQDIAMPQQQLIAKAGPINVNAHKNINRTGTLMAAAGDGNEHAETGSVKKNPLVLQTLVETREEKDGLFSSTETVSTSLTHQVVPSTAISGTILHDKAGTSIQAIAPQDSAGQKIIYESPDTNIEGIILADRTTTQTNTSSAFSEQSQYASKETPYAMPAHIQAPVIQLVGKRARINANIYGDELHDDTEEGAEFVAKVAQMLCSGQTLVDSPFMSVDAGSNAGYETMLAPMLMVEKIIRANDNGHMLFESAIIDKDRTEIIGKCVETTYQLKQWQTSWCHKSQLIPDEALVVVAITIAIATQGAGVEFLTPLLKSIGLELGVISAAMVNAGVATVCSSAGTSFLRTGNPLQTVEQLASPAQLKSIAFSMASAGLCAELGNILDINMKPELKSFASHVSEHALRNTVDTLLNIAINNVPVDKALGEALKQIPLKAAASYAANKISMFCTDAISRKTAHTVLGGLSGFAMENNHNGFVSGAVGALTAETVGDILISDAQEVCIAARTRVLKSDKPITMEQAIDAEINTRANIAKIVAGTAAVLTKQNPSIAIATGSNTLDNGVRATLYANDQFKAMVAAASQAMATLQEHGIEFEKDRPDFGKASSDKSSDKEETQDVERTQKSVKSKAKAAQIQNKQTTTADDNAQLDDYDFTMYSIQKQAEIDAHSDIILEYAHEKLLSDFEADAHDLTLHTIDTQSRGGAYEDIIFEHAQEKHMSEHKQHKLWNEIKDDTFMRLVFAIDNMVKNPSLVSGIKLLREAFTERINETIDFVAFMPNPAGLVCFAGTTGRDLYQEKTTPGEVVFNMALGYGVLKGIQWTGKGIKFVYQNAKGAIKDVIIKQRVLGNIAASKVARNVSNFPLLEVKVQTITNKALLKKRVLSNIAASKAARETSKLPVPFVENSHAIKWTEATISDDLALHNCSIYEKVHRNWKKNPKAPFNVMGHGNTDSINVAMKNVPRHGLSQKNLQELREYGKVSLNEIQLLRLMRVSGYQKGQSINLSSCLAGARPNGLAQKLANRADVFVSAPTEQFILNSRGTFRIASKVGEEGKPGIIKTFYPQKTNKIKMLDQHGKKSVEHIVPSATNHNGAAQLAHEVESKVATTTTDTTTTLTHVQKESEVSLSIDKLKESQVLLNTQKTGPHGTYEDVSYHVHNGGQKSPAPKDGQQALDSSIRYSENSPNRVGINDGHIVALYETGRDTGIFHGHIKTWEQTPQPMKNALIKSGFVDHKGKVLK